MNNAKMWLVVQPTVGIPLFLGAVAVGSFAVHLAVLSKTHWYEDYLVGKTLGTTMSQLAVPDAMEPAKASFTSGSRDVLITMPDGSTVHATLEPAGTLN